MQQLLYVLPALVCPIGMGAMMWLMMRGRDTKTDDAVMTPAQSAELARLQAQLDEMRSSRSTGDPVSAERLP